MWVELMPRHPSGPPSMKRPRFVRLTRNNICAFTRGIASRPSDGIVSPLSRSFKEAFDVLTV